ncbi:carbohydrate ABC transporter permease [Halomonas salinarum]|uniref:carbohydrate ABC transporter permease n=1 Tax=Halomonas salinarum TaxID=1158993 RepID=UPI00143CA18D|nr:carbohydrate ABC transporter permease [Halomonas salinarum]
MSQSKPTTPAEVRQRAAVEDKRRRHKSRAVPGRLRPKLLLGLYLLFVLLPIYWLMNMSFQSNTEILGGLTLWPDNFTLEHYTKIFTTETWYMGYVNSITYVVMNMVISILVALPAAYAFSRYHFIGDKHLFFWLLTNLMAPPAVFLLPYFQLYYTVGLFDTHIAVALAHCLFNIPLAIWILEGFMSSVPKEIDETAFIDGYSFPRFFVRIFIPMIRSGIGVTLFFLFMFSWVELLLASTLTSTNAQPIASVMTSTSTASGIDWGTLAAAGVLTILPGILVVYFVRNHIAKGFALGRT